MPKSGGTEVRAALEAVEQAYRQLELSSELLLKSLADVQEQAVASHRAKMINGVMSENLLQDLSDMQSAFEDVGDEQVPDVLRPFTDLPQALTNWLEGVLGLKPVLRRGQDIEVPRETLGAFSVSPDLPMDLPALVRIRVKSPGWESPAGTLIRPSVVLISGRMGDDQD